ncbi:MAG: hypothetical protein OXB86_04030 [Bdellovibrionales bacterium]|nr:hypothetical protein [Bdellovibrionales bacterium]
MRWLVVLFLFNPMVCLAVVDTQSAGYSKTFIAFKSEGAGFPLKVEYTNNSRSLYNGLFGYGWCSNFETRLTALPDNSVKSVECGGGLEIFYYPKNKSGNVDLQVNLILKGMRKSAQLSGSQMKTLKKDLRQSQTLRADFMEALNIKGKIKSGVKYYANGRASEYVILREGWLTRHLPNGISEVFNRNGRLVRAFDKSGNRIDITWGSKEVLVKDNRGRRLQFVLGKSGKVKDIKFNGKVAASFKHDGKEDLRFVRNAFGEEFFHNYDNLHNLTENIYPDKTTEKLTYNKKKDWVTTFKNRKGCLETYGYGKNPKNPNHYHSTVKKVCGRRVVNNSRYEFWNKPLPEGKGKYLYRARARVNGRLTDVIYHQKFGTPVSLLKNGVRTARKYYESGTFIGLLKEKRTPYRTVRYQNYSEKCRKPQIVQIVLRDSSGKKVLRTENTSFQFRPNCQLYMARKSKEEWIKVRHDEKGRIDTMEDQSRKVVKLKWHPRYNKPEVITRQGVGSIRLIFNAQGGVVDVKGRSGPTVMSQVASVFNSFLETLSPVAEEMVIL